MFHTRTRLLVTRKAEGLHFLCWMHHSSADRYRLRNTIETLVLTTRNKDFSKTEIKIYINFASRAQWSNGNSAFDFRMSGLGSNLDCEPSLSLAHQWGGRKEVRNTSHKRREIDTRNRESQVARASLVFRLPRYSRLACHACSHTFR